MANNYTTKTAALKSTTIDTRLLEAKKITIDGEDILTKINTTILDERGTLANGELDIWNSYVTKDEEGNYVIDKYNNGKTHFFAYDNVESKVVHTENCTEEQALAVRSGVIIKNN